MQKTSKELAEFYGIEVGDHINVFRDDGKLLGIFLVKDFEAECPLQVIRYHMGSHLAAVGVDFIGTRKYEVIKHKKKYGDLKCKDFYNCFECPLRSLACTHVASNTLYEILEESWLAHEYANGTDNPIYKAFKAELDKEVEE